MFPVIQNINTPVPKPDRKEKLQAVTGNIWNVNVIPVMIWLMETVSFLVLIPSQAYLQVVQLYLIPVLKTTQLIILQLAHLAKTDTPSTPELAKPILVVDTIAQKPAALIIQLANRELRLNINVLLVMMVIP